VRDPALDAWGGFDRDNPFPLFARVRAAGPVHEVTLPDGQRAWLVARHAEADPVVVERGYDVVPSSPSSSAARSPVCRPSPESGPPALNRPEGRLKHAAVSR